MRERDRNMCVWCADEGVVETEGLSVHHVVPLEEDFGKRDDMDNLATLCARHHELAERGEVGRDEIRAMVARQQERFGQSPPGVTAAGSACAYTNAAPGTRRRPRARVFWKGGKRTWQRGST